MKTFQLYFFDLDGVIYRGNQPLPGAVETVRRLQELGRTLYFLTNNSSRTRQQYAQKLQTLGIPAEPEQFLTSAWGSARYLQLRAPHARLFVVGEIGLKQELLAAGLSLVQNPEGAQVDWVVVGLDREFTYEKLAQAQRAILNGARFLATNRDATFPAEDGHLLPGAGALVAALQTATGVEPLLIGKPETWMLQPLLENLKVPPGEMLLIGDRLDTDVTLGKRLGIPTALVLTGVTQEEALQNLPSDQMPDYVLSTLSELVSL